MPDRTPPPFTPLTTASDDAGGDDAAFLLRLLAHDLRNPLAALTNAAQLARTTSDAGISVRALAIVERECVRLADVVDDVVDLATLAGGPAELTLATLDVEAVAGTAIALTDGTRAQREHELAVVRPGRALAIRGDEERLVRAIVRLLERASAVTPRAGCVHVAMERAGLHAVVRVSDAGPALDDPALRRLFALPRAGRDAAHGPSGAALPWVARVAALHGGTLTATRAPPGNAIALSLPLAPGAAGRRVLVVDDDRDTTDVLCPMLERDGHLVHAVHRAADALPAALAFVPDAVLLDIALPDADGLAVARELRRHAQLAAMRIYAVSGFGRPADLARSRAAGVDEHITKPVALDRLRALLRAPDSR